MAEILVVDDDLGTRNMLAEALRAEGHHVVLASSAVRALQVLEDNRTIELVLTDVIMPLLDGREFVATVRRDPSLAELPIIIMSATVGVSEISRALGNGASRFLAKPVRRAALYTEVDACLRQSKAAMKVVALPKTP
jgi:CheY-like chemotaxis protein